MTNRNAMNGRFAEDPKLDAPDKVRQLRTELGRILRGRGPLTREDLVWAFDVCQARPPWSVQVIDQVAAEEQVARLTGGK